MNLAQIKNKFKNKQDLAFLSLGILMSIIVFTYLFYSISFLISKIESVLGQQRIIGQASTIKFNIDKIEPLETQKIQ